MQRRLVMLYAICVHMLFVLALVKADSEPQIQGRPGMASPAATGEITEHYERMLRYHQRMDGNVPDHAVVFIGDSLTQGLCVDAVATPSVNYGIGSDTSVGVLRRLPKYRSLERASIVVIAIGINDMTYRDNEAILENYSQILEALPRSAHVIVSAVLPVDETRMGTGNQRKGTNDRVRSLNVALAALCQKQPDRCLFVDVGAKLVDQTGKLDAALSDPDGVHLTSEGNKVWIEGLKKAVATLRQRE